MGNEINKDSKKKIIKEREEENEDLREEAKNLVMNRKLKQWEEVFICTVEQWKRGYADIANFSEKNLFCDRILFKECSPVFCLSRQKIFSINKNASVFNFRRKVKFSKMAEHFEYNHIPAQMSSVNQFRVEAVLCFKDSYVVLLLSQNENTQLGLLDLDANKFQVFGRKFEKNKEDVLAGQLSPDKSKCLIQHSLTNDFSYDHQEFFFQSKVALSQQVSLLEGGVTGAFNSLSLENLNGTEKYFLLDSNFYNRKHWENISSELLLYDLNSRTLLSSLVLTSSNCHFSFDPRYSWHRFAINNFSPFCKKDSLSFLEMDMRNSNHETPPSFQKKFQNDCEEEDENWLWVIKELNCNMKEGRVESPFFCSHGILLKLEDLRHSRDGRFVVATFLTSIFQLCMCHRISDNSRPNPFNFGQSRILIFNSDSAKILHSINFENYICSLHSCHINFLPIFSDCGTKMAFSFRPPSAKHVQKKPKQMVKVINMPWTHSSLQGLSRAVILSSLQNKVSLIKLPSKIINYLSFQPEFS